ncbi:hypothetical protein ACL1A3_10270 [Corynebacterium striatum]
MALNTKVFTLKTASVMIGGTEWAGELSNVVVTTAVQEAETRRMVNGDEVAGESSYSHTLKGKVEQNLTIKGLAGYLMQNKGQVKPCVIKPHTTDGAIIAGNVRLDPVDIGGDANTVNTSDLELKFIGDISFTAATKINGQTP